MVVNLVRSSFSTVKSEFKDSYRSNRFNILKIIGILLVTVEYSAIISHFYIDYISHPSGNSAAAQSSLFHYINLAGLLLLFIYGITNVIGGASHPILFSKRITNISRQLHIDNDTLYFSALMKNLFKSLIFSFCYYAIIVPIQIIGHFPLYYFLLTPIVILLGMLQLVLLVDLVFFLSKEVRQQFPSSKFLFDESTVTNKVIKGAPLIILDLLLVQNLYFNFNQFSKFTFLPLINSSVGLTGLFLRSGLPVISIYGIISELLFVVILLLINVNLAMRYDTHKDTTKMMANYTVAETYQTQLYSMEKLQLNLLDNIKCGKFQPIGVLSSLFYKDLLAIKRTKSGNKLASIIITIPFIWIMFYLVQNTIYVRIIGIILIFFLADFLQIIYVSETDLPLQFGISKQLIRFQKVVITFILIILVICPFFSVNFWHIIIFSGIISIIFGIFYDLYILTSKLGKLVIMTPFIIFLGILSQSL